MIASLLGALGLNKTVATLIEIAVVLAIGAGLAIWIMTLREKAAERDVLLAQKNAIEVKYGCDQRPSVAEHDLAACLIARDRDAAIAKAFEIDRERKDAAKAQAAFDHASEQASKDWQSENEAISAAALADDGTVPKVLLDAWTRERKRLGIRK